MGALVFLMVTEETLWMVMGNSFYCALLPVVVSVLATIRKGESLFCH